MKILSSKKKIELIAKAALAKKAENIVLLDLRKLSNVAGYFMITSGNSSVQIDTIADNIEKELSANNCRIRHREGNGEALWVLLDCGDVIVHVFHKETRVFYNLEKLWHDAPRKMLRETVFRKRRSRSAKKTRRINPVRSKASKA